MNLTTKSSYRILHITPSLPCHHWQCKRLTRIAHLGKHIEFSPYCFEHGYAERNAGGIGFSRADEHASIKRYVIESLQLLATNTEQGMHVQKCSLSKVRPYGYKPYEPLQIYANMETYHACHFDDIAWRVAWDESQVYVVWFYDTLAFRLYGWTDEQAERHQKMSSSEEEKIIPLAPSGVSPWYHRASLVDGRLTLYWNGSHDSPYAGPDAIRTFTREETATLLDLLYAGRDEILTHQKNDKLQAWLDEEKRRLNIARDNLEQ